MPTPLELAEARIATQQDLLENIWNVAFTALKNPSNIDGMQLCFFVINELWELYGVSQTNYSDFFSYHNTVMKSLSEAKKKKEQYNKSMRRYTSGLDDDEDDD